MSDKEQFIVTCRFPGWSQGEYDYPPFGIRYLITTPIITPPDWPEDDERWISYDEEAPVIEELKRQFFATIGKEFTGDILFIEPSQLVKLHEALPSQDGLEVSEEPLPKSINRNQE